VKLITVLSSALVLATPAVTGDADVHVSRPVEFTEDGLEFVDLELVLAVDVSSSIDEVEARRQRDGHVAALADPEVISAIQGGGYGRIAIMYLEWADGDFQRVVAPWTVIETEADARGFAATLAVAPFISGRRTAIGAAIDNSVNLIETNDYEGIRKVVDISGDGPQNSGSSLSEARTNAEDAQITVNGLPIQTARQNPFRPSVRIDVAAYFENEVIAGPGAFISPSEEHGDFVKALRQKLIIEIAGLNPALYLRHG
jgi:subtilisin family serine protease